jgi:N-acetylglucosaminyldiphosphoundecaprenol N-acetyl-beta-D-mannosaminyltransferase
MGMPRQETWILENQDLLDAPVIYANGAAFEYFSGYVARPPAWISKFGLEWLFRLFSEPKRLWRRYLVEPLFLLPSLWLEMRERV